jgi:23S rRNA pseudouridine1911/1915/1917 synthase
MVEPSILAETAEYLVVYKPPRIHSAPLRESGEDAGETLLGWCVRRFPEVRAIRGRQAGEGGILHRLDYETSGLVLFARTQAALDNLMAQQGEGLFTKEYLALSAGPGPEYPPPGFPPGPRLPGSDLAGSDAPVPAFPQILQSAFRSYGPGRREVRPVVVKDPGSMQRRWKIALDRGGPYRTAILGWTGSGEERRFRVQIRRGFRHQIRCHLAWAGYPLVNDRIYGGREWPLSGGTGDESFFLGLRAWGLSFFDPRSREKRVYTLAGRAEAGLTETGWAADFSVPE